MFIEIQQQKESGFNRSQVKRRLGLNWKTVDKYWTMETDEFADAINQASNRTRKLSKYEDDIVKWLRENPDMTAAQVEDWLKEHHRDDSIKERTVRSYVAHLRDKHGIPKQTGDSHIFKRAGSPMGHQMQWTLVRQRMTESDRKSFMCSTVCYRTLATNMEVVRESMTTNNFIGM